MKLSVQLVTWNGEKYLPFLFESLKNQTYTDWQLRMLDNNSNDHTLEFLHTFSNQLTVPKHIIPKDSNLGFAGGHNLLYQTSESEYVLLLNQDMYLGPTCFEDMVTYLDTHPDTAAAAPRLMRWNFDAIQENDPTTGFTNEIDALGLRVFRSRRVAEAYTKQNWQTIKEQFQQSFLPVFGVSGAFPIYRRSALKAVAFEDGTFLDQNYHSYKEDVDLAYRLQIAGYEATVLLDTVAFHDRSGAGPREMTDVAAIRNKKNQSSWVKYHSYKNHLATLYKNEYGQNFVLDFPWILWYEVRKFVFFLCFDQKILLGLKELFKARKRIKKQRNHIKSTRKVSYKKLRKWW